jgi:predicted flap endonuclease-1-like 5' DNA nuclease
MGAPTVALQCAGSAYASQREPGSPSTVTRFTLIALIIVAIVAFVAYRLGIARGRPRAMRSAPEALPVAALPAPATEPAITPQRPVDTESDPIRDELARLVRAFESEAWRASSALADSRAETERYRRIVVDIENNAPPPLFDGPGTPDDLKLIVGVGPVLERMLHQLGVGSFRQIARWTERDIDAFDAKLPEFPGRIRRDAWVTQARELHVAKYGERP